MKKLLIFSVILALVTSCSESFLDTQNLTQKNSSNFPSNAVEANQALTGAYSVLTSFGGMENIVMLSDLRSDDRFGGGGQNDRDPQAIEVFRVTNLNLHSGTWSKYYQGIYRCNTLLASLGNAKWDVASDRTKVFGETSFLRGYFYFDLARLFGPVPLVINPEPVNLPKATPEELYGQIASDLKNAIDSLPAAPLATNDLGRATKWAAEALMARVFLFYTGYYEKSDIKLPDGSIISKQQVIDWVDDCIANSGHSLVPDFRNQWPYTISGDNYAYVKNNNLSWVGEEGGNKENIFTIRYMALTSSDWNERVYYSNQMNLFFGQRYGTAQVPLGRGWGFGPVNPNLFASWPSDDVRKQGSIMNVDDPSEGIEKFNWGADMQWQETGLFAKKYIPVNIDFNGKKVNYSVKKYGAEDQFMLNNTQDIVVIRLADVLLMGAELGSSKAQQYMDMVRSRAKLPSVAPTLDNIKLERRYELAFEGLRYFDLLRWYGKEAGAVIKQNESGAKILNMSIETTINQDRNNGYFDQIDQRVRDTGGFLMIPDDQIQLSKGVLEQNPGWTNSGNIMF